MKRYRIHKTASTDGRIIIILLTNNRNPTLQYNYFQGCLSIPLSREYLRSSTVMACVEWLPAATCRGQPDREGTVLTVSAITAAPCLLRQARHSCPPPLSRVRIVIQDHGYTNSDHMYCMKQILQVELQQFVRYKDIAVTTGLSSITNIIYRRCKAIFSDSAILPGYTRNTSRQGTSMSRQCGNMTLEGQQCPTCRSLDLPR